ncbi:hypothetical protein [Flavobacterium fluviatile]|uniref:hypothetical protein n=1 Tax=Flavobacterium fluviatile TaxID=1862387 RepID=UPI001AD71B08|nr:hypothetical protein [Flavobacterium fluviatile]
MSTKSLNQILTNAGIEIIRISENPNEVKLKYNGKEILRGYVIDCYSRVKRFFNIDLKEFE